MYEPRVFDTLPSFPVPPVSLYEYHPSVQSGPIRTHKSVYSQCVKSPQNPTANLLRNKSSRKENNGYRKTNQHTKDSARARR